DHIYDQQKPREYAQRQIEQAAKEVGDDIPRIRSIEIRPGTVETFKVSIGGGTVAVTAEELNDFRWFNRACIAQLRRSFMPMKPRAWSIEVDRALRVAKEPVQLIEEQVRWHGTEKSIARSMAYPLVTFGTMQASGWSASCKVHSVWKTAVTKPSQNVSALSSRLSHFCSKT